MTAVDALLDISILATETRVRGIGRYLAELAPALQRAAAGSKLKVGFVESTEWLGDGRVDTDAEAVIARLLSTPEPSARLPWAYRLRAGAARATRAAGARLLHLGMPNVTPWGDTGGPRLLTCHDLIPTRYPEHYATLGEGFGPGRRALDRRRWGSAAHVIAISKATADDLMRLLAIPASRITVVYNGVKLERWSAEPGAADATLRQRYDLGERSLLVYAGDADWRKNASGMLRALERARRLNPRADFALAWAGKLSAERRAGVQAQARELGVDASVKLLGFVPDEDLAALYRQAHATVFVSRAEGFGYPVLEAMACGSPVVTSNVSSLVEVAGDVAVTVDPEDPERIAEAVVAVEQDAAARAQRTARGRDWVARFSCERQARETLAVYERLLA
ncbi:MAG TPA: glycosyltransferase family 1 protein [Polyangiaceae bacterium]|nr:glycosyltransferase family 1 protein [Polyangiaceae bacterium]